MTNKILPQERTMAKVSTALNYIVANIASVITIAGGLVVVYLDRIGMMAPNVLPRYVLLLISGLAISELIERSRRLGRIENELSDGFKRVVTSLGGVHVHVLGSPEEAYEYMRQQISKANSTIEQASMSPAMPRWPIAAKKYEDELQVALKKRKVRYRYVALLVDDARVDRINRLLKDSSITSFFAGVFQADETNLPMIGFLLCDEREVVVHYPLHYGEGFKWIAIRHPQIVEMFKGYFHHVWIKSRKIDRNAITSGELDRLIEGIHVMDEKALP
jgi:hypothetical protein